MLAREAQQQQQQYHHHLAVIPEDSFRVSPRSEHKLNPRQSDIDVLIETADGEDVSYEAQVDLALNTTIQAQELERQAMEDAEASELLIADAQRLLRGHQNQ